MTAVVIAKADDEIADLIERVRASADPDVGLVVPGSSKALATPLNVRLLAQFSNQSGRHTSIVTEDPRLQQLARTNGLQVYGSVPAFERGIELAGPRGGPPISRGVAAGAGGMAAAAVLEPPPAPPPAPPQLTPPAHAPATARQEPRRVLTQLPPARPTGRGWDRRRFLYVAGAAVAVIGIVLFMALAPSAKITISIAATPLSANPTIQGSTDPTAATKPDHVLTGVVTSHASAQFQATPTGTTTVPAVSAKVTVLFSTNATVDIAFTLDPNAPTQSAVQTSDQSITFVPARKTVICIGPDNPPHPDECQGKPFNATAPYVALNPGASGNVGSGSLTFWSGNPCPGVTCPNGTVISVTNESGSSGGTDAKQVSAPNATDIANWTAQVTQIEAQLATQIQTDLQARAGGKTFAKDPAGNGESIAYTDKLPTVNTPFNAAAITVIGTAQAATYDPAAVRNDVIADLDKLVKPGEVLAKGSLTTPPCAVTQANVNGTIILACSATAYSQPMVNLNALKAQLTGRNPGNAQTIVERNVAKVQGVQVSESPFKLFYLPLRASQIEIVENFVAVSTKSP